MLGDILGEGLGLRDGLRDIDGLGERLGDGLGLNETLGDGDSLADLDGDCEAEPNRTTCHKSTERVD